MLAGKVIVELGDEDEKIEVNQLVTQNQMGKMTSFFKGCLKCSQQYH